METTGSFEDYIKLQLSGSDWSYGSRWGDQMESAIRDIFSRKNPNDRENLSVIDIGCGEGRGLHALHSIGYRKLYGIDISDEKIQKAKQTSDKCITYIVGDFHDTYSLCSKFNERFEYGFCSHTLEHSKDFTKAIISITSVINRILYFIVPVGETEDEVAKYNPSHTCPFLDINDVEKRLIHAGIKDYSLMSKGPTDGRLGNEVWGIIWCSNLS